MKIKKKITLYDRLYASMNMATDTPARDEHGVSINYEAQPKWKTSPDINIHFDGVYLSMSVTDWIILSDAVNDVIEEAEAENHPAYTCTLCNCNK